MTGGVSEKRDGARNWKNEMGEGGVVPLNSGVWKDNKKLKYTNYKKYHSLRSPKRVEMARLDFNSEVHNQEKVPRC